MEDKELDFNFEPNTGFGKEFKKMVDNGDICDGNVYWLIDRVEKITRKNEWLNNETKKYKDMCREHYEEMLKQEKKANQLEIENEILKQKFKEIVELVEKGDYPEIILHQICVKIGEHLKG